MHKDAELLADIVGRGIREAVTEPEAPTLEPQSSLKLRVRSRVSITDFNAKSKRHFVAPLGVFGVVVGKTRAGLLIRWDAGVSFGGAEAPTTATTEIGWSSVVNLDTLEFAGLVEDSHEDR